MNYEIVKNFPHEMIFSQGTPCISLYQPTHRHSPGNKQDPIVFKNLIREIENSLGLTYAKNDIATIMKPFYQLEAEKMFWNHTLDGLAILATADKCIVYRLNKTVREQVAVSDSFNLKPLIKIFQSMGKYQLLGLSRSEFSLYEGDMDGLVEIEMDSETPQTIEQVLGGQFTDPFLTFGSHGDGGTIMYHGHGGKKDEIDKDAEKFFRYVDGFVAENYSKPSRLPLILVAVTEHHGVFEKISNNPFLMEEGIKGSYRSLTLEQMIEKAGELLKPIFLEKTQNLVKSFEQAKANGQGSADLAEISKAAFENRVETIMIEALRVMPGRINPMTGAIESGGMNNPTDDILDDLTEMVLKKKGEVLVLPKELMPGDSGVAAIYRY